MSSAPCSRFSALWPISSISLLADLLALLLELLEPLRALLARFLERLAKLLELGLARWILLLLQALGELAHGLLGVCEPLFLERLCDGLGEVALLELASDALQALFQRLTLGLGTLGELALE